jgi:hypothetical protein
LSRLNTVLPRHSILENFADAGNSTTGCSLSATHLQKWPKPSPPDIVLGLPSFGTEVLVVMSIARFHYLCRILRTPGEEHHESLQGCSRHIIFPTGISCSTLTPSSPARYGHHPYQGPGYYQSHYNYQRPPPSSISHPHNPTILAITSGTSLHHNNSPPRFPALHRWASLQCSSQHRALNKRPGQQGDAQPVLDSAQPPTHDPDDQGTQPTFRVNLAQKVEECSDGECGRETVRLEIPEVLCLGSVGLPASTTNVGAAMELGMSNVP